MIKEAVVLGLTGPSMKSTTAEQMAAGHPIQLAAGSVKALGRAWSLWFGSATRPMLYTIMGRSEDLAGFSLPTLSKLSTELSRPARHRRP
jgi:hypothetical protein